VLKLKKNNSGAKMLSYEVSTHPFKSHHQAIKYKGKIIHVIQMIIPSLPPSIYNTLEVPEWK